MPLTRPLPTYCSACDHLWHWAAVLCSRRPPPLNSRGRATAGSCDRPRLQAWHQI